MGKSGYHNPVHESFRTLDGKVGYLDQLYIAPEYPITLAARFADAVEYNARMENVPGAVTAIPESPWSNALSTRLAYFRGFSRKGAVSTGNCTFGLFVKPYISPNISFQNLGDHLMTRH